MCKYRSRESPPPVTTSTLGLFTQVRAHALDAGEWPIVGTIEGFDPDEWPEPPMLRGDDPDKAETPEGLQRQMERGTSVFSDPVPGRTPSDLVARQSDRDEARGGWVMWSGRDRYVVVPPGIGAGPNPGPH